MNYILMPVAPKLVLQILCGIVVYIIMCWALKIDIFVYALKLLREMLQEKKSHKEQ